MTVDTLLGHNGAILAEKGGPCKPRSQSQSWHLGSGEEHHDMGISKFYGHESKAVYQCTSMLINVYQYLSIVFPDV